MRGDIIRFTPVKSSGSVQQATRYGVIVQTDVLPLSTVIVAPTSQSALATSFRPVIQIGNEITRVLVEQIAAIDVARAATVVGHVTLEESWAIDEALELVVGLT